MKLTFLFLMIGLMHVSASVYSQSTRLTLEMQNKKVVEVLHEIEKQSEFRFAYSSELIDVDRKVSVNINDKKIEKTLDAIFEGTGVTYALHDRHIMLYPKEMETPIQSTQQNSISGTVSDDQGLPLPGVTVLIKGTTNGSVTNLDGNYTIPNVPDNATIQFSFVGMLSQEIEVGSQNTIDITMEMDAIGIEEVVAVGYGTIRKRDVTGAMSSISGEDIDLATSSNFIQGLQGKATGLQITGGGGSAGAQGLVRIRGINSISSGTEPLWVIDGLIVNGSNFEMINPNDINSIEILKDAASTAIYGSRGSNGVIIITTKRGITSELVTNISINTGVSDLTRKPEDIGYLGSKDYFTAVDQARANSGKAPFDLDADFFAPNYGSGNYDPITRATAESLNTNWYDEAMRIGSFMDANASLSAKKDKYDFYASLNYKDEKGVAIGNDLKRFSALVNLSAEVFKNFKLNGKLSYSYMELDNAPYESQNIGRGATQTSGGLAGVASIGLPWMPVRYDDGSYWNPHTPNLALMSDPYYRKDQTRKYRILLGLGFEYSIPKVEGLKIIGSISEDINHIMGIKYLREGISSLGLSEGSALNSISEDRVADIFTEYKNTFGKHRVGATLGYEEQKFSNYISDHQGRNIIGNYPQYGTPNEIQSSFAGFEPNTEHNLRRYLGRVTYNYDDRYLFSATMSRDGSSRFSEKNRWEIFPAIGMGWIPSSESFWKSNFINFLKLRASFGKTGNSNIPNVTNDIIQNSTNYRYGDNVAVGSYASVIGSDVTWEVTDAFDLGMDYKMFDNRVSGEIGYYNRDISRLLLSVPLPPSSGLITPTIHSNIGDMTNQGLEFSINTINIEKKDFLWSSSLNITTNSSEVTKLSEQLDQGGKGLITGMNITRTGSKIGQFYIAEYAGINSEYGYEEIYKIDDAHFAETGNTIFELDESGNRVRIAASKENAENNRYIHEGKSGLPSYYGSLNNKFKYKNFDLSFSIYFQGGNYLFDMEEQTSVNIGQARNNIRSEAINDAWSPTNKDGEWPLLTWDYVYVVDGNETNFSRERDEGVNSRFLHKGNYARLNNLQIGYNIPKTTCDKLNVNNIRLYLQGTNLFTVSNYKGYDPDIFGTSQSGKSGTNLSQGYVSRNVQIPTLKTFVFGVNVQF